MQYRVSFFVCLWLVLLCSLCLASEHIVDANLYCPEGSYEERNAYAVCYDKPKRIAKWVAYSVVPDYRKTPDRDCSQFKKYRNDPKGTFDGRVPKVSEYKGYWRGGDGYAYGHLAPYGIMGGDRDNDGKYAMEDLNGDGLFNESDWVDKKCSVYDEDDALTVYQGNYMSNMSPQIGLGFNAAGVWYYLERWIQDVLVSKDKKAVYVIAGTIFENGQPIEYIGPQKDIWVPTHYFKIVMLKGFDAANPKVLAFVFPNIKAKDDIFNYTASIDTIEAMTGLDLFSGLFVGEDKAVNEKAFESVNTGINRHYFEK